MRLRFLDYRYAESVLEHDDFRECKRDVLEILENARVPLLDPQQTDPRLQGVKRRKREARRDGQGPRYFLLPVDQKALNLELDDAFVARGWTRQPLIVTRGRAGGPVTGLKADYKKKRVQVEAQFGNMARWYTDVFKFQLSYSLDEIDVAVLVVPMQSLANLIDENVAYFERVIRELPWAKMSLTLPIWVIGIEPDDYDEVRVCYETAGRVLRQVVPGAEVIPFDSRLAESQSDEGVDGR